MKWLSGAITVGAFGVLYWLEKRRPLRRQLYDKEIETARNLAIAAAAGLAVNFLEKPVAERLTKAVERRNVGLVKTLRLPRAMETALAVVLLDYTLYLWHVLTHKVPFLWNFHRIHHADLDLQASTAVRFHFAEMTISVAFRAAQIVFIGVSPQALSMWQTLLFLSIFFHHSNVRLPKESEKLLQKLIVTPRLHGIHHSIEEDEMNSNWSSGLTVWDRLHDTFRDDVAQDGITIGVKEYDAENQVAVGKMLAEPFLGRETTNG